jgi:hypothetical protein
MQNTVKIELSKDSAFDIAILVQYALNHNSELSYCRQAGVEFMAQATRLCSDSESASRVDLPATPSALMPIFN